ncbi:MAG: hypothetical protein V1673_00390 [Candidatus Omnitrophota bacterium]
MLERNDELIEQFNKEEQKRQRLQRRKRARRKRAPSASKEFHKLFDRLDAWLSYKIKLEASAVLANLYYLIEAST